MASLRSSQLLDKDLTEVAHVSEPNEVHVPKTEYFLI